MNRIRLTLAVLFSVAVIAVAFWVISLRPSTPPKEAMAVATALTRLTTPTPTQVPSPTSLAIVELKSTPIPKATPVPTPTSQPTPLPTPTPLPSSKLLVVAFTSQAPFAKWDALHEDACEETSLIMVHHYLSGRPLGDKTAVDKEITDMVAWEEAHGYGPSITASQLSEISKQYLGVSTGRVKTMSSITDIKREIAAGRPVIIGMAGKVLPNPNFSNGGPNYHMLVAIGYDETSIITNDPGTRQGSHFAYTYQAFFDSAHDWVTGDILQGSKNYLVF